MIFIMTLGNFLILCLTFYIGLRTEVKANTFAAHLYAITKVKWKLNNGYLEMEE